MPPAATRHPDAREGSTAKTAACSRSDVKFGEGLRTEAGLSRMTFPPIPPRMRAQGDSPSGQITWLRVAGRLLLAPDSCGNRKRTDRGKAHEVQRRFHIPTLATCTSCGSAKASSSGASPACAANSSSAEIANVSHICCTQGKGIHMEPVSRCKHD